MEKGSLRADVNVSVRRPGEKLGTRCEIKNVNSIRFVGQAIEHEARRQIAVIEDGGTIDQETRLFDPVKGETRAMRSKEEAHDYRYFPDPDLLPLELEQHYVDALAKGLPEREDEKALRFEDVFGLTPDQARRLVKERDVAEAFEGEVYDYVALLHGEPAALLCRAAYGETSTKLKRERPEEYGRKFLAANKFYGAVVEGADNLANLILGTVFAQSNEQDVNPAEHIRRLKLPRLIRLILDRVISGKIAKDVFEIMWTEGGDPAAIVEARGLKQVTDTGAIEKLVDDVIAANPDKVADAKTKPAALGWFVGQVMKASQGKANPQAVNELLKAKLGL
jgi:aspartyl-tRNA(Asn)/glutamyl-tRNA(Gln) amidotransferase subunit B